eukprot:gene1737-3356_t
MLSQTTPSQPKKKIQQTLSFFKTTPTMAIPTIPDVTPIKDKSCIIVLDPSPHKDGFRLENKDMRYDDRHILTVKSSAESIVEPLKIIKPVTDTTQTELVVPTALSIQCSAESIVVENLHIVKTLVTDLVQTELVPIASSINNNHADKPSQSSSHKMESEIHIENSSTYLSETSSKDKVNVNIVEMEVVNQNESSNSLEVDGIKPSENSVTTDVDDSLEMKVVDSIVADENENKNENKEEVVVVKSRSRKRKTTATDNEINNANDTNGNGNGKIPSASSKSQRSSSHKKIMPEVVDKGEILATLDSESRKKYDCCMSRQDILLNELLELEKSSEFNDEDFKLQDASAILRQVITECNTSPPNLNTNTNTNTNSSPVAVAVAVATVGETAVTGVSELELEMELEHPIAPAPSLSSPLPLSLLVPHITSQIHSIITTCAPIDSVDTNIDATTTTTTTYGSSSSSSAKVQELLGYCDPILLAERIKEVAGREVFGVREKSSPSSSVKSEFEETSPRAVMRWKVINMAKYLPTGAQVGIKDCQLTRTRYGKALKSSVQVSDLILSQASKRNEATEITKLQKAEEYAAKCFREVEASKARREEVQRRKQKVEEERLQREQDKLRREQEKEAKRLVKEEELRVREETTSKKKKEQKASDEKQQQQLQRVQDAKSQEKKLPSILGFFKTTTTNTTSGNGNGNGNGPSPSVRVLGRAGLGPRLTLGEDSSPKSLSPSMVQPLDLDSTAEMEEAAQGTMPDTPEKIRDFEELVMSGTAMDIRELQSSYRKRSKTIRESRVPRGHMTISVTLLAQSGFGAFDNSANNVEIRDVSVDSRMRYFGFHADHRPPYWGTFSKRSRDVTGRRPFGREQCLDYDYDSEAEWEEPDDAEAEDIANSEGDEEGEVEGGNELEYDEFFLHDNDFGSDADSDGEMMTATNICSRVKSTAVELIGPLFVAENGLAQRLLNGRMEPCGHSRLGDAEKLFNSYKVVLHTPHNLFPELGKEECVEPPATETVEVAPVSPVDEVERKQKTTGFREDLLVDLIHLVHGKKSGIDKLVEAFQYQHTDVPKAQIKRKIQSIAQRQKAEEGNGSFRWIVNNEVLVVSGLELPGVEFTPAKVKRSKAREDTSGGVLLTMLQSSSQMKRKREDVAAEGDGNRSVRPVGGPHEVIELREEEEDCSGEGEEDDAMDQDATLLPLPLSSTTTSTATPVPAQRTTLLKFFGPSSHRRSEGVDECKEGCPVDGILVLGDFEEKRASQCCDFIRTLVYHTNNTSAVEQQISSSVSSYKSDLIVETKMKVKYGGNEGAVIYLLVNFNTTVKNEKYCSVLMDEGGNRNIELTIIQTSVQFIRAVTAMQLLCKGATCRRVKTKSPPMKLIC